MSKICSSCNTENVDEAKFCRKCGEKLEIKVVESSKIEERVKQEEKSEKNLLVTLSPFIAGGVVLIFIMLNIMNENKQLKNGKEIQSSVAPQIEQKNISINSQEEKSKKLEQIGELYPLDPFTLQYRSDSGYLSLKIAFSLDLNKKGLIKELDNKKSVVRDKILIILASKTLKEISTRQGKKEISEQIINTLNAMVINGKINDLYFTEFVIQ